MSVAKIAAGRWPHNPTSRMLVAVEPAGEDLWAISGDQDNPPPLFRLCANRTRAAACNWLVPSSESHAICLSCRLTRTISESGPRKTLKHLRELEAAKRRVLFSLQNMQLPLIPKRRMRSAPARLSQVRPLMDRRFSSGTTRVLSRSISLKPMMTVPREEPRETPTSHTAHAGRPYPARARPLSFGICCP